MAGIYGLLVTFPLFFLEGEILADYHPAMNHPEYYYGFVGVAVVWQILFLFIARDPIRFRPLMAFCSLEKLSLVPTVLVLAPRDLFPQSWIPLPLLDLAFGVLFVNAFFKTKNTQFVFPPVVS